MTGHRAAPWVLLVLGLLLASCAPKRSEIVLDTAALPAERLLEMVRSSQQKLTSLTGHGNISFESPSLSGSAFFDIAVKKPDSLLAKFEGPFGIDVGTLFLSRDLFVLYNSMENEVTTGSPNGASIRSMIPFDLNFDQILNAFTGVFTVTQGPDALAAYTIDEDRFRMTFHSGANLVSYWVDPDNMTVTRFVVQTPSGQTLVEADASRIHEQDGVNVPRRITVAFPGENRQLAISYLSMQVNTTETSFAYSVPASAHKISR